jgi:cell division protein FtsA
MKFNEPYLIISLTDDKIIFFVISYDENKNFKLLKSSSLVSDGIQNGRIVNINLVIKLIKTFLISIEDEVDSLFSKVSIIINPNNVNCLNISGYKKLNGSQVSKEDIIYILNDIKKIITTIEDKQSLVHLFNSSFSLDSDNLENLPIGLFGDFYNQSMTFFLIDKNILKNIKLTFSSCGLDIERIILRSFAEGVNFLLKNQNNKNFITITLGNKKINISLFKNKSYIFTQDFDFGIDLVVQDISKLCSLNIDEVKFFLKETNLKLVLENDSQSYIEKKFFSNSPYRKIKHQLILDIIKARLDEIIDICYKKNSNLDFFKKNENTIYLFIENFKYFKNIQFILEKNKLINAEFVFGKNVDSNELFGLNGAVELISRGWEKEAIPVIQSKKSLITSFFSRLFS